MNTTTVERKLGPGSSTVGKGDADISDAEAKELELRLKERERRRGGFRVGGEQVRRSGTFIDAILLVN